MRVRGWEPHFFSGEEHTLGLISECARLVNNRAIVAVCPTGKGKLGRDDVACPQCILLPGVPKDLTGCGAKRKFSRRVCRS